MTPDQLYEEVVSALEEGQTKADLRQLYLGRKGKLTELLRSLGQLSAEERRQRGQQANVVKGKLERLLAEEMSTERLPEGWSKKTENWTASKNGSLHPETQFLRRMVAIFSALGFRYFAGNEVELTNYNFDRLNIPNDHPARDVQDTFYLAPGTEPEIEGETELLLRTHVSQMQIRIMERERPPIRAIYPGRVFRNEATDARHLSSLFQFEGMVIEKGATLGQLLWVLNQFAEQLVGHGARARIRPSFFPFVEPGVELDLTCLICRGQGCRVCSQTGWLESGGAGMIHPNVLREMRVDPTEYSGFAFGMGVGRMLMLSTGMSDIRLLAENDIRFLEQFLVLEPK